MSLFQNYCAMGDYRIVESYRLEKTLKIISSNINLTLASPPLNCIPKRHVHTFLKHLQDRNSTISLDSPFQCLTTLFIKKFFLTSNLNCLWKSVGITYRFQSISAEHISTTKQARCLSGC